MGDLHLPSRPRRRRHARELLRESHIHAAQLVWKESETRYVSFCVTLEKELRESWTDTWTVIKAPPFNIKEKGWGEFDMQIILTPIGSPKGGDQTLQHDLNFQQERYESTHTVVCTVRLDLLTCVANKLYRHSATPSPSSSSVSKSLAQLAKVPMAPQQQQESQRRSAKRPTATSTWRSSPRPSHSSQKKICCRSCRWSTTTSRKTRTLRMTLKVSRASLFKTDQSH